MTILDPDETITLGNMSGILRAAEDAIRGLPHSVDIGPAVTRLRTSIDMTLGERAHVFDRVASLKLSPADAEMEIAMTMTKVAARIIQDAHRDRTMTHATDGPVLKALRHLEKALVHLEDRKGVK